MNLSEHFHLDEFRCRCGCKLPERKHESLKVLAQELEEGFRIPLGVPVHISSGFRCEMHNKTIGGAKHSMHVFGMAADIVVVGLSGLELKGWAEAMIHTGHLKEGGLGTYKDKPNVLHYDYRGFPRRWRY
jgi:uncharacterized protein YcbK (DUF882 family)